MTKKLYNTQRCSAKFRGIEWQFTYETWIAWWGNDIERRGRRPDQLVMARLGDTGPYHPDNVKKITGAENSSETRKGKVTAPEVRIKISAANQGRPAWNKGLKGDDSHMKGNLNASKKQVTTTALLINGEINEQRHA